MRGFVALSSSLLHFVLASFDDAAEPNNAPVFKAPRRHYHYYIVDILPAPPITKTDFAALLGIFLEEEIGVTLSSARL